MHPAAADVSRRGSSQAQHRGARKPPAFVTKLRALTQNIESGPAERGVATRPSLDTALIVLLGALLVAISYSLGRSGVGNWGQLLYWSGQAVLLLPAAIRLLATRVAARERILLVQTVAAAQSLLAWCYSPDQFRFPDELQHVRTASDILTSGHLFATNSYLPVSPGFPALEEIAVAISRLSGLPFYPAAVITASVAHILFAGAIFFWVKGILGDRVAGVAVLVAGFTPHYAYFDTLFVYSVIALPFMVYALQAAAGAAQGKWHPIRLLAPVVVVMVSHHLTALVTCCFLWFLVASSRAAGADRHITRRLAVTTAFATTACLAWTALVSRSTFGYLATPLNAIIQALSPQAGAAPHRSYSHSVAPAWESGLSMLAVALLGLGVVAGCALLWAGRFNRLTKVVVSIGFGYPAAVAVRLFVPGGSELSARALTYVAMFSCVPVAVALVALLHGRGRVGRRVALLTAVAILGAGTITVGVPPTWERLPGSFHIAAFESGIDERVSDLARWGGTSVVPGDRVACDYSDCSVLGGYTQAQLSTSASGMYYQSDLRLRREELSTLTLDYAVADRRMTVQTPKTGLYFFRDILEGHHSSPLSASLLDEFDADPLINRVYDNGDIAVYGTRGVWHD